MIVLYTSDEHEAYERLVTNGVAATPPFDHGFATLTAFQDPDGNHIQLMTPAAASSLREQGRESPAPARVSSSTTSTVDNCTNA